MDGLMQVSGPAAPKAAYPPRVIWMLWLQGWDKAPPVARAARNSWQGRNPGWRVQALDRVQLSRFLPAEILEAIFAAPKPPEALSDQIRLELLHRYGGVWADATTLCLRPLDQWLPAAMPHGFFAFDRPGPDRMIASWFLAAEKGSVIVGRWRDAAWRYWQGRTEPDQYFWVHNLFAQVYGMYPGVRALWDGTPKITAQHPLHFGPDARELHQPPTAEIRAALDARGIRVAKLTHKFTAPPGGDSTLALLCAGASETPGAAACEPRARRLLLGWYGTFEGHGTVGDLRSLEAAVSHLVARGHAVTHATAAALDIAGAERADWQAVQPESFDAVLFVCGPILRQHPETGAFFDRFRHRNLAGLGVSLLPPDHFNHLNPFARVFARQGLPEMFGDIAVTASAAANIAAPMSSTSERRRDAPVIGLALRGVQNEYGAENLLADEAAALFAALTDVVARHGDARITMLENHLVRAGVPPDDIERAYARCDLVLTTRFHGAVIAMRQGVPFIALDHIRGGAKVLPLLRDSGWPAVGRVDASAALDVIRTGLDLLHDPQAARLTVALSRAVTDANRTLAALDAWLESLAEAPSVGTSPVVSGVAAPSARRWRWFPSRSAKDRSPEETA